MSDKLHELSRRTIAIKNGGLFHVKWNETLMCVTSDAGVNTFELTCDSDSLSHNIDVSVGFEPNPSVASLSLFAQSLLKPKTSSLFADRNLDPASWIINQSVAEELNMVISMEWSPRINNSSILATLTSNGCVQLFLSRQSKLCKLINLTDVIITLYSSSEALNRCDASLLCKEVQSSCVCWGFSIDKNQCLFVTAQRSSKIIFWRVTYPQHGSVKCKQISSHSLEFNEIKTMTWINGQNDDFALVCSSFDGLIKLINFKIEDNKVTFLNSEELWLHKDRMVVRNVCWYHEQDRTIFLFTKNRFVIVFILSKEYKLLHSSTRNINDFTITALTKLNGALTVATENFELHSLSIDTSDCSVSLQTEQLFLTNDYSDYVLHDVATSNTEAFLVVIATRKLNQNVGKNSIKVIFFLNNKCNSIEIILKNPTEKLTCLWDCIEMLRIQFLKEKPLPTEEIENLFTNRNISTYHMKVYLILWKFYNKNSFPKKLPETTVFANLSPQVIKNTLLMKQAVSVIGSIHQAFSTNNDITKFESDALRGSYSYVKFFCSKYNLDINSFINRDDCAFVSSRVEDEVYVCVYCDTELQEFRCVRGHPNMFCCLTLQPIRDIVEYLECRVCGSTAHKQLSEDKCYCVFCDVLMDVVLI